MIHFEDPTILSILGDLLLILHMDVYYCEFVLIFFGF
jgi:hypothetical protein